MGHHLVQYVLLPHVGDWANSRPFVPAFAHWFNEGYVIVKSENDIVNEILDKRLVWIKSHEAEPSAIKPAESGSGYVLRIVEMLSKRTGVSVNLSSELNLRSVLETDLLERPLENQDLEIKRTDGTILVSFSFNMKPHEIKSFLLRQ